MSVDCDLVTSQRQKRFEDVVEHTRDKSTESIRSRTAANRRNIATAPNLKAHSEGKAQLYAKGSNRQTADKVRDLQQRTGQNWKVFRLCVCVCGRRVCYSLFYVSCDLLQTL